MNNQIQIFTNAQFGEIRTSGTPDNPLFCLVDVCKALGLKNPSDVKRRLLKRGVVTTEAPTTNQFGAVVMQEMTFITEPNVYKCIFQSRKQEAELFQEWVTSEVLPSIRKHGAYMVDEALHRAAREPEYLMELAQNMIRERDARIAAEKEVAKNKEVIGQQETQIATLEHSVGEMKEKVSYYDIILGSPDAVCISQIAADYGMYGAAFNKMLANYGILQKQTKGGQWILTSKYIGRGLTVSSTYHIKESNRHTTSILTKWTQKGRHFLYLFLKEQGVLPLVEQIPEPSLFDTLDN